MERIAELAGQRPRPRHLLGGVHRGSSRRPIPHYDKPCWYTLDPGLAPDHEPLPRRAAGVPTRGAEARVLRRRRQPDLRRRPLGGRDLDPARGDRRRPVLEPGVAHEHGDGRRPGDDRRDADGGRRGLGRRRSLSRARASRCSTATRRRSSRRSHPIWRQGRARRFWSARRSDPQWPDSPGLVVLSSDGEVESTTPGVERWLSDLPDGDWDAGRLPSAVHAVASRALRTAESRDEPGEVALARVLSRSGTWVVLHGTSLVASGSRRAAVIVEPAHPGADHAAPDVGLRPHRP